MRYLGTWLCHAGPDRIGPDRITERAQRPAGGSYLDLDAAVAAVALGAARRLAALLPLLAAPPHQRTESAERNVFRIGVREAEPQRSPVFLFGRFRFLEGFVQLRLGVMVVQRVVLRRVAGWDAVTVAVVGRAALLAPLLLEAQRKGLSEFLQDAFGRST